MAWNPSIDANVAGYKVYYGTASRSYAGSVDVGNVTNTVVTGLADNTSYYFAATTYDQNGVESDFSNEAFYQANTNNTVVNYQPPTLNSLGDISVNENSGMQTVSLTGISLGTGSSLVIAAFSSNPSLIPNPTVSYVSPATSGTLSFAPASDQYGTAVITVTANNGQAQTNTVTRTFTVTVVPVLLPPTLDAIGNISINENAGLQTVNLTGISLGSGQTLAISAIASNPSLIPNPKVNYTSPGSTGTLSFMPTTNTYGSASITVTANNGQPQNNTVVRTFAINVAAVYAPPTLGALSDVSIDKNTGLQTVNLIGIGLGTGQTLTITAVSSDPSIIPNPKVDYVSPASTGTLSFMPITNAYGMATITVTANNGLAQNSTITRAFKVNVTDVNSPTLDPISDKKLHYNSKPQNITLDGVSAGAGNDNGKLKIYAVSSNPHLIANPQTSYNIQNGTGNLVLSPMANTNGTAIITVTIDNGQPDNNLLVRTFSVTVAPNQPPTLDPIGDVTLAYNSGTKTVNLSGLSIGAGDENQGLRITAVSSDPTIVPNPGGGWYDSQTGTGGLRVSTINNASGVATITVTVDDGQPANNTVTRTFKVTVLPNQPPTLDPIGDVTLAYNSRTETVNLSGLSVGSTNENQGLRITAVSSDTTIVSNPGGGWYDSRIGTGGLHVSPVNNASGVATITVTVDDGQPANNTVTRTFKVTVLPNQPPTLDPIGDVTLAYDSIPKTVKMTGITVGAPGENQGLRITAVSDNLGLVANPGVSYDSQTGNGTLSLRSMPKTNGVALITVTLDDGQLQSNVITRTFKVTISTNLPPTLDPIADVNLPFNSPSKNIALSGITVGAPDENQGLRIIAVSSNPSLVANPGLGYNISTGTGTLSLRPMPNTNGIAVITVTLDDGSSTNNLFTRTFSVTISPEPAPANSPVVSAKVSIETNSVPATLSMASHTGGSFTFQVDGSPGGRYAVQASSDLVNWTSVETNTAPFLFEDTSASQVDRRFYRAVNVQ